MKKDIHPANYREVVFKDMSNEEIFITRSTVATRETIEVDGVTYPLVKLEITSASHPFFTGKQKLVDAAGRQAMRLCHRHSLNFYHKIKLRVLAKCCCVMFVNFIRCKNKDCSEIFARNVVDVGGFV